MDAGGDGGGIRGHVHHDARLLPAALECGCRRRCIPPLDVEHLRQHLADGGRVDAEADVLRVLLHRRGQPDDFPEDVEPRPAGTPRVDAGVGLNQAVEGDSGQGGGLRHAVGGADDPRGAGVQQSAGIADDHDRLAEQEIAALAQLHRRERPA